MWVPVDACNSSLRSIAPGTTPESVPARARAGPVEHPGEEEITRMGLILQLLREIVLARQVVG